MDAISRRAFLSGVTSTAFLAAGGDAAAAAPGLDASLEAQAQAKGLLFGAAVKSNQLSDDAQFAAAVLQECDILVHEWELKRHAVQRESSRINFALPDAVVEFAERNGLKVRGHTLVWHYGPPRWLQQALRDTSDESLLTDYIAAMCKHYRGRMQSWDVVNEAIEPKHGHPEGYRMDSVWYQTYGTRYVDVAFHAARAADPDTPLYYNDYFVEMAVPRHERRRYCILKMLEGLKARNVPVDGLGIQGHLRPFVEQFDQEVFARFVREVQSLGLKLMVTELDVADRWGPADVTKRDAEVAAVTRDFMDVVVENPATVGVLTWGLSDRYSWLSNYPEYKWPDGQLSRGLPLDADMQRKPMWHAIARSFASRP